jgi:parvulin-like peptidyl-prolyl isomerase
MMRQMRENTKWIMLVTALAFAALMVFEWGMDITGRTAGGVGEIGRVNGEPVYYEDYLAAYRNLYDQVQQAQTEPITSQQNSDLEDQAFDQVVSQILIRQELERRGIRVTDDEIRQAARFSPPPALASNPAFLTEGSFDFEKYQTFLASQADDAFLLQLEAYYRDIIPRSKLLRQVSLGVYPSDSYLWQLWRDQNETVEVRFVPLNPGQRIPDDSVEVTDDEVRAYYQAHQDDFEQPARATVRVVVLRKAPTPADTAAQRARAAAIVEELRGGAEFTSVASRESDDEQSAQSGGDLGVLTRGQVGIPAFDSALFAAPRGEVVGPLETPFGNHILRVDERWGEDSVRARHILVAMERTDSSEIALLTRADSLEELGESRTLEEAGAELGLEAQTSELTEAFAFVAGAGQVGEGADWAFNEAEPGEVSPVFENGQAFYALELVSRTPGGVLPLENARTPILQILGFEKKLTRVRQEGAELVRQARAGEALPNVAAAAGLEVRGAGPFARNDFVPGLGRQNAAVGAAFGLTTSGEVTEVVATTDNAYVLELIERTPADSAAWVEQKEAQRQQAIAQLRDLRLQEWLEGLRQAATVVDRRDQVLQPADEDAPLRANGPFGD